MNRRGKRLTLGVMAVGLAVVLVLVILYRGTVRDHVEAWHFQLTRATETIEPHSALQETVRIEPNAEELPVGIWLDAEFDSLERVHEFAPGLPERHSDPAYWLQALADDSGIPVVFEPEWAASDNKAVRIDTAPLQAMSQMGCRVLEQRFPRRAYVVIRDQAAGPVVSETLLVPFVNPAE